MEYIEFINKIKSEKLLPVYIFIGEEIYLMDQAADRIKEKYIDKSLEDINYIVFDRKNIGFDHILNACETLPFMSSKKIIIIKNINELMDDDKEFDKKLGNYVKELEDYLCLLIICKSEDIKKTSSIYKNIKKLGGVVEFTKLKGRDLNLWVESKFKEREKSISPSELNYFIQQSGYNDYNSIINLYDLENEIIKIVNFSKDNKITKDNIDLVMAKTLDNNIFNLLNAINKKDRDTAIKVFGELYVGNEPVQKILFMITRQIRLMLGYKLYKSRGDNESDIQKKLQIGNYEFKRIGKESKDFSENSLIKALDYILETDIKQKTSSQDEKLAMEILIINLSYIM